MSHPSQKVATQHLPRTTDQSPSSHSSLKSWSELSTRKSLTFCTQTISSARASSVFRPRSSTQEALLSVTRSWHELLTKHRQVACVFFDVKKAFDSVPHSKILDALFNIGIRGQLLNWIHDYLSNRHQRVVLDGISSVPVAVTSGVPQGSILGPLLFNIVMDSITRLQLSKNAGLILYADDILLFKPIDSPDDISQLQADVDKILSWMASQGLTPNHTKTQVLPITRSRNALLIDISINGHRIVPVSSVKYLGVSISSDLSWSGHIGKLCKKAKQHLGLIHRRFHQAPSHVRAKLYRSAVLPNLECCGAVWDPHHQCDIQALENVQKFASRVTTRQWKDDYRTLLTFCCIKFVLLKKKLHTK